LSRRRSGGAFEHDYIARIVVFDRPEVMGPRVPRINMGVGRDDHHNVAAQAARSSV
jgi:hypothetical protein